MSERLMNIEEVADLLGVARHTVYQWRSRGDGPPGYRLGGGRVRYRRAEVLAWLEEQRDESRVDLWA